jgi:hypothetical protein
MNKAEIVRSYIREAKTKIGDNPEAKAHVISRAINELKMKKVMATQYTNNNWALKELKPRVPFVINRSNPTPFPKSNAPVRIVPVASVINEDDEDSSNKIIDVGGPDDSEFQNYSVNYQEFSMFDSFGRSSWETNYFD